MWLDWNIFAQAVRVFLAGGNPYSVAGFYNPVWVLPLLIPFVLLGEPIGQILYSVCALTSFGFIAYRVRASLLATAAFLVSLPVVSGIVFTNLDWLPLFALFTPPPIALLLAFTKPQLGSGIAVYLLYRSYRERNMVMTAAPLAIVSLLSVSLYGLPRVQTLDACFGT